MHKRHCYGTKPPSSKIANCFLFSFLVKKFALWQLDSDSSYCDTTCTASCAYPCSRIAPQKSLKKANFSRYELSVFCNIFASGSHNEGRGWGWFWRLEPQGDAYWSRGSPAHSQAIRLGLRQTIREVAIARRRWASATAAHRCKNYTSVV